MTAGLVVAIFAVFNGKITSAISSAIDSVTSGTKGNEVTRPRRGRWPPRRRRSPAAAPAAHRPADKPAAHRPADPPDDRRAGERGAAVVEFVMVSTLLIFVLFAVLQVAVYFYVRNIASASAANGARYAASSNVAVSDGGPHADELMHQAVASVSRGVTCTGTAGVDATSGLQLAVVECRGHLHSTFLPIGSLITIDIRASTLKEAAS